jgi:hypothetical protein
VTLRRCWALLLLVAHAAAAAHLVLEEHALSGGELVEAGPQCALPRHGAVGIIHGHRAPEPDACAAVALFTSAASRPGAAFALAAAARQGPRPAALPAGEPPLDVLSLAPKASPPGRLQ